MAEEQLGFDIGGPIGRPADTPAHPPFRPEDIRADMAALLAEARSVIRIDQWDARTLSHKRRIFPLIARWLPEDEATQLCFEFDREIARIELLRAA